eukprot:GHRQ01037111.1.p2 GENE.GHRQ01037111.1~~GHRQ01037111.1.p2  ORF type:complete len:105 (-),score=20.43 GHRQ01037111.1:327-641(-)
MSEEDFDAVLAVNLKGVFLTCQAAAQQMVQQGRGGSIITMSSVSDRHNTGSSCLGEEGPSAALNVSGPTSVCHVPRGISCWRSGPQLTSLLRSQLLITCNGAVC